MRLNLWGRRPLFKIVFVFRLFFLLTGFFIHFLLKRAEPVFVAQSSNYSNTAFTDLVNKCIIKAVDDGGFEKFSDTSSENGITAMMADTAAINSTVSKLMIDIQNALNGDYQAKMYIPLGSLSGYYMLY